MYNYLARQQVLYWLNFSPIVRHLTRDKTIRTLLRLFSVRTFPQKVVKQIVHSSPTGTNVRLKDIATVKREYPDKESQITNNGKKCLLLSVEMKKGQNIVKMGEAIDKEIEFCGDDRPYSIHILRRIIQFISAKLA